MTHCNQCHQPITDKENRCPHCGSLNSKIDDILAREAAEKERNTLKGRIKSIIQAEDKKLALNAQLSKIKQAFTKQLLFSLFVAFVFIFAMTLTVI